MSVRGGQKGTQEPLLQRTENGIDVGHLLRLSSATEDAPAFPGDATWVVEPK